MLSTLVFIFGGILFVGAILAFFVWLKYRQEPIKNLLKFWITGIFSYFAQGLFHNGDSLGLIAFSFNSVSIYFLLQILKDNLESNENLSPYLKFLFASSAVGVAIIEIFESFFAGALVYCAACSLTILYGGYRISKGKVLDFFSKGYLGLLGFAAIHFLDYPFFRSEINLTVFGFALSILFYFTFAVFVPILILQKLTKEYTAKLELEVDIRTLQLKTSYHELEQAFSSLKATKEQIDLLLSDTQMRMNAVVHDVSTPLQVLGMNFRYLLSNKDKDSISIDKISKRMETSLLSMKEILSEAKTSHAQRLGKAEIELNAAPLRKILADTFSLFDFRFKEKNITAEICFPENLDDVSVLVHESWLKNQIMSNLVSNAIKFSNRGGKIRCNVSIKNEKLVTIEVSDDGVGIPPDKQEAIFNLDKGTSTIGTEGEIGTGLGLPIVKQYLELMGGTISLKHKEEPGACFEIELKKAS